VIPVTSAARPLGDNRRTNETSQGKQHALAGGGSGRGAALSDSMGGLHRGRVDDARAQFERRTETAEGAMRTRLAAYEQVLRSAAARIASEPAITSGEWHDFIEQLQLP